MKVDRVGIIAIRRTYVIYYHTHSKNIVKYGENPQSARIGSNYHTKCGKNCHEILSVFIRVVKKTRF